MESNELRIGNWVLINGQYNQVESVNETGINLEAEGGYYAGEASFGYGGVFLPYWKNEKEVVVPIPLTPELLVKCGFDLQPQRVSIYILDRLKLWMGHNGCIAYLMSQDMDGSYWIGDCQSLHQLQNLYFALTNSELPITNL